MKISEGPGYLAVGGHNPLLSRLQLSLQVLFVGGFQTGGRQAFFDPFADRIQAVHGLAEVFISELDFYCPYGFEDTTTENKASEAKMKVP